VVNNYKHKNGSNAKGKIVKDHLGIIINALDFLKKIEFNNKHLCVMRAKNMNNSMDQKKMI
jgi:hypothetical protein